MRELDLPDRNQAKKMLIPYRISLSLKASALVTLLVSLMLLIAGLVVIRWQRDALYSEKLLTSKALLGQFANNVRVPLLEDEILNLNMLVKDMSDFDGLLYALIVDLNGVVKAHTDSKNIGAVLQLPQVNEDMTKGKNISHFSYRLPSGRYVFHLSKPVIFRNKKLGSVHLGFSQDSILHQVQEQMPAMPYIVLTLILISVSIGICTSILLRKWFTEPICQLIGATEEIKKGNFKYEIKNISNNELGDLALALMDMSQRIREKISLENSSIQQASPELFGRKLTNLDDAWDSYITRRQVTVLFAGIKGFKTYANKRDPRRVLEELNEYFAIASNTIGDNGGYVDKFIGDAVIGVFESSPLKANHSERAISCAVALQDALKDASKEGKQLLGRVGVGISSGVVLLGRMGSETKTTYAFIGESFRAAYSLNVMAGPGEIVMSKDVYQLIDHAVSVEPLPPREMIDRSEPWENFRLQKMVEKKKHG